MKTRPYTQPIRAVGGWTGVVKLVGKGETWVAGAVMWVGRGRNAQISVVQPNSRHPKFPLQIVA